MADVLCLAVHGNLHWTFIGKVERGQRNVSLHSILKLAEALGVDPAGLKAPGGADSGGAPTSAS
ncbi:helix-turn-helix domain-containing protein [Streptomyces sp. NPDC002577]